MYGSEWCGDCRRAKRVFERLGVPYDYIDPDDDPVVMQLIREFNGGLQSIPVIVFPDGSHLTEPSDAELEEKLRSAGLLDAGAPTGAGD